MRLCERPLTIKRRSPKLFSRKLNRLEEENFVKIKQQAMGSQNTFNDY